MAGGGVYCTVSGRTALSIAREVCGQAHATIAVGSCAWDGGLAAAAPNPTGATGVGGALPGLRNLVSLPGCPANVVNLTATLVHMLTFGALPSRDGRGRPRASPLQSPSMQEGFRRRRSDTTPVNRPMRGLRGPPGANTPRQTGRTNACCGPPSSSTALPPLQSSAIFAGPARCPTKTRRASRSPVRLPTDSPVSCTSLRVSRRPSS